MFVISVNPGNLIQRAVQANMNSGGKVELDMHAPPTIRKMWIPAGGFLLKLISLGFSRSQGSKGGTGSCCCFILAVLSVVPWRNSSMCR